LPRRSILIFQGRCRYFWEAFRQFDIDGNGSIDAQEMAKILDGVNVSYTKQELQKNIDEVDTDKNGTVEMGRIS